jgi:hypothetical protein
VTVFIHGKVDSFFSNTVAVTTKLKMPGLESFQRVKLKKGPKAIRPFETCLRAQSRGRGSARSTGFMVVLNGADGKGGGNDIGGSSGGRQQGAIVTGIAVVPPN